jgi:hypothetical protein
VAVLAKVVAMRCHAEGGGNIVHCRVDCGGRFVAMEAHDLLVGGVRRSFRTSADSGRAAVPARSGSSGQRMTRLVTAGQSGPGRQYGFAE